MTDGDHLVQARLNEFFTDIVLNGDEVHFAWAITAIFYAAVHYGRAVAVTEEVEITSHIGFAEFFARDLGHQDLYRHYRTMKDLSEKARYDCQPFSEDEVRELAASHLAPFRDAVLQMLP